MATIKVSNVSQLMNALNNAKGVTTIDANNPASITSMILIGAKNVTFDGINFDYSAASGANVANRAYMLLSSDNITMQNSVFDGDLAKGTTATANGYGTGIAIGTKDTNNLTITNNTFTDFHKAVVVENGVNVDVTNNDISGIASDGINFAGVTNGQILNNHLHDFASHANTSAHKDMIQIWSKDSGNPSKNIDIKDNVLNSAAGTYTHGIMLKSENGKLHQDSTISKGRRFRTTRFCTISIVRQTAPVFMCRASTLAIRCKIRSLRRSVCERPCRCLGHCKRSGGSSGQYP